MAIKPLSPPPFREPIADVQRQEDQWGGPSTPPTGLLAPTWQFWFTDLRRAVFGGVLTQTTRANAPTNLTPAELGALFFITDFGHVVRWAGTAYEFADGGNGFFQDFAVAPSLGWALCNGGATTYLTVGPTLGEANITLPDLAGSPAYRKSGAAYTGSILAASGSTGNAGANISGISESTTPETSVGDLGSPATRTVDANLDATTVEVASNFHRHTVNSHGHGSATLSVDPHQHGIGTIDVARLVVLPFFRR
jgi:hypothetical protein